MTDRELRRLKRIDLLELALFYARQNRALRKQLKVLRAQLEGVETGEARSAARKKSSRRKPALHD